MITKQALTEYVQKHKRKFFNRHKIVGASEIGQCARKTAFSKLQSLGPDPGHEESWGAAARGRNFEDTLWVPAMRARYGEDLLYTGKRQKSFVLGYLSATPDGLLINQPRNVLAKLGVADIGKSGCVVIDCKTIDPRIPLDEAKYEHTFQLQVQMGMFRELTKYQPDYGVLSYTNASFFDDIIEFAVPFKPSSFEQAKHRAALIMNADSPDELLPEGWIAGGKECKYCPFAVQCQRMRGDVPKENGATPDPQFLAEIHELVTMEREWASTAGVAETRHREMQAKIKERLKDKGLRRIDDGVMSVVWSSVVGRTAFDMPALRAAAEAAGFDISAFERVGEATDRLTIKLRREG